MRIYFNFVGVELILDRRLCELQKKTRDIKGEYICQNIKLISFSRTTFVGANWSFRERTYSFCDWAVKPRWSQFFTRLWAISRRATSLASFFCFCGRLGSRTTGKTLSSLQAENSGRMVWWAQGTGHSSLYFVYLFFFLTKNRIHDLKGKNILKHFLGLSRWSSVRQKIKRWKISWALVALRQTLAITNLEEFMLKVVKW